MRSLFIIPTAILVLIFTIPGYSIPRFALMMGGTCSDCHFDPSGAGLRNDGGFKFERDVLPMMHAQKSLKISDLIGENIYFGFDYRTQYLYSQQFNKTDFQKMQGTFYTDVNLTDKLDLYGSYDFINNIWEGFAIAHILPNSSYIKVGTFRPNFGIQLDDHTAYTRGGDLGYLFQTGYPQGLIYNPWYTETGMEVGANFPAHVSLTASVGSPRTASQLFASDPTYTARIQYTPIIAHQFALMLGGSYANFRGSLPPAYLVQFPKVNMYGGFFGFGTTSLTIMGEYDVASDYVTSNSKSSAAMAQITYQWLKGFQSFVRYDRFDPNMNVSGDELQRVIVGLDLFPYSFTEVIPEYRFQFETPSVKNDSFVLQFHFYY